MGLEHEFELLKEHNHEIVKEVGIHDDFLDCINSKIGVKNNLFYQVPSVNPAYAKEPYALVLPEYKGFNRCGVTVFNQYCVDELGKMFLQWKEVAKSLPSIYYYQLEWMDKKDRESLTADELEAVKERFFDKAELLEQINGCLEMVECIKSPEYILFHKGI